VEGPALGGLVQLVAHFLVGPAVLIGVAGLHLVVRGVEVVARAARIAVVVALAVADRPGLRAAVAERGVTDLRVAVPELTHRARPLVAAWRIAGGELRAIEAGRLGAVGARGADGVADARLRHRIDHPRARVAAARRAE